jgi:hypothetical protein
MFAPYADLINGLIVVASIAILCGLAYLVKLTKASGFYWKAAAFGWIALVRLLLVVRVEPFVVHSAQVTLPFYLLFGIGLWLTIAKLLSVYRNGRYPSQTVVTAEQAAELVRLAKEAAILAANAASDALIAAETAERAAHASGKAASAADRATADAG